MISRPYLQRLAGTFALITCAMISRGAAPVPAQEPAPSVTAADEELFQKILKPRDEDVIKAELSEVQDADKRAEAELSELKELDSASAERIEVKKAENEVIEQRIELAKKEKNAAAETAAKASLEQEKVVLGILEQMRKVTSNGVSHQEALRDAAKTRREYLESELKVLEKRKSRVETMAKGAVDKGQLDKIDQEFHQFAERTMNSLKDYSSKVSKLSETAKDVAEAKMQLIKSWSEYRQKYGGTS